MAYIPKDSIFLAHKLRPSTFVVWCLLWEVRDKRESDVYLSMQKAAQAGVKKSAYYSAFVELEKMGWVRFSGQDGNQKRWMLATEFSANVENNSTNAESDSTNAENNSANVERFSTNVETPPTPPYKECSIQPKETTQRRERDSHPPMRSIAAHDLFEIEQPQPMEALSRPYEMFLEVFPTCTIDGQRYEDFNAALPEVEETVWRQTLMDWRLSGYKASNLAGLISRYKNDLERKKDEQSKPNSTKNPLELGDTDATLRSIGVFR